MRQRPKPPKPKAKRPVAPTSAKNQSSRVRDLERRLAEALKDKAEALDQQTATSEILHVISSSPTDLLPALNAVAASAARVCQAYDASIFRLEEGGVRLVAHQGPIASLPIGFVLRLVRETVVGRSVLDRRIIHLHDVQQEQEEFPEAVAVARRLGSRTTLAAPLLREGVAVGAILIRRTEVAPFSPKQIALLETFADQAVIAIENVRLFTELQTSNRELTTALDTQTATSDILRVISRSQTDVQPVFDAIVASAVRLLGAYTGVLTRIEGDQIVLASLTSTDAAGDAAARATFPRPLHSEVAYGQVIRDRTPLNIADAPIDPRWPEAGRANARIRGYRSLVVVPLLRHDEAIGALAVSRREPGGFANDEMALLQTFADQAVIAIENVRLFKELEGRNTELREALEQQTATSELLKVIGRSTFDLQPVFETLAENAVRLCEAERGLIFRFDRQLLRFAVGHNVSPEFREFLEQNPLPLTRNSNSGRAAVERRTIHNPDVQSDPEYTYGGSRIDPYRTVLAVPMLRGPELLGTIVIYRHEVRPFSDNHVALMETFADQAAIAIENARLLTELQARTQELSRSVGELQALGEVSQAVSSTLDLPTVLSTIVARATLLAGADAGIIYEYDGERETFRPQATERLEPEIVEVLVTAPVRKGEGATGQLAVLREPVQLSDIHIDYLPSLHHARDAFVRAGYRALLAVPLLREGHLIGGLTVMRKMPGEFPRETVELLQTFATQSFLAIQNARLFREIEEKSRQLEVASQHKSEFLANMSHELRTPLNAIIGFSEVLSERMFGELNEKQEEYSKDIHASGQHLLSLINDILDLSKIEAGRMELELSDFHLPTALENALTLVRERAGRRSIALHTSIDNRLGEIQGDERKIRQVVLNLLSNAIKFTPEGGRIEVAAVPKDGSVEVSVSDTGVGIAPEDQEKVFEEFRQVGTAEKKAEGTGLGLTLCRKFIELHGGKIWVKSEPGLGSTFTFTIPVHRGE
jgi:signal transduction histidine kinase